MPSLDLALRISTFIFLLFRVFYWVSTGRKADREKPKLQTATLKEKLKVSAGYLIWVLLAVQLLILDIFPFPHNTNIQLLGFILSLLGIGISIIARNNLGINWAHAGEYQIKKNHELVTTGIYHYIRHPIYFGLLLCWIGGELVAESYLVLPLFIIFFYHAYVQGKKEEKLLLKHFGKKYEEYMKTTKMLIPFVI